MNPEEISQKKESDFSDTSVVDLLPKRRRSLSKRLSLVPGNFGAAVQHEMEVDNVIGNNCETNCSETHDYTLLKESIQKLKTEEKDWKQLRQHIKDQYASAKSSYVGTQVLTVESCSDILSEEDRQFLNDQPDYDKIQEDFNLLVEMESYTARMHRKMEISAKKVIDKMIDQSRELKSAAETYVHSFE